MPSFPAGGSKTSPHGYLEGYEGSARRRLRETASVIDDYCEKWRFPRRHIRRFRQPAVPTRLRSGGRESGKTDVTIAWPRSPQWLHNGRPSDVCAIEVGGAIARRDACKLTQKTKDLIRKQQIMTISIPVEKKTLAELSKFINKLITADIRKCNIERIVYAVKNGID